MDVREKYKLLAFTTLFKMKQRNSCILKCQGQKKLAGELKLSYNTFKKYRNQSVEAGILIPYGKHQQFLKLTKVISILELNNICVHNRFYKYTEYEKVSLKNIYNKIIKSLLTNNFKRQAFNIKKKEHKIDVLILMESNSKKSRKFLPTIKKLRKEGTTLKSMRSTTNPSIVSGKFHAARIIEQSPSTAIKWLQRLCKEGDIKRIVVKQTLNIPYSNIGWDTLNLNVKGAVIPFPYSKSFIHFKGSRIELLPTK